MYVPIYQSFYEVALSLDDDRRLKLYDAVMEYGFLGTFPDFDDEALSIAFKLIRPNLDTSIKRQRQNAENIAKRWEKANK